MSYEHRQASGGYQSTTRRSGGEGRTPGRRTLVETEYGSARRPQQQTRPSYVHLPGDAFIQGFGDANEIDANDVGQGQLGDCYLMASMVALAHSDPQRIRNLIR